MFKKIIIAVLIYSFTFIMPHNAEAVLGEVSRKNVIFMVMDGTNSDVVTLARHYKGKPLALDQILTGGVHTYSLRSAITDSAAAATAMATGHKTTVDFIGMVPVNEKEGERRGRPVANVLEAAKEKGLATGIIATAPVQHATPAAFSAHSNSRHQMKEIGFQQAHQNIDVMLGGGKKYSFLPSSISTKKEMMNSYGLQLHGFFSEEDMAYDFDREKLHPEQPSLAEMTKKALQTLNQNSNGFLLFIEGSKVDFAGHKNDPVGMVSEVLAFDDAVKEALQFAKTDQNTLLIAVTDHGNSGLTMGNRQTDKTYPQTPPEQFTEPLKKASLSVTGALSQLKENRSNIKEVLKSYGLDDLSKAQIQQIKKEKDIEKAMVQLMANRAHLGFTTRGHSGEDVFLYSYGGKGVLHKPQGLINNTDLPEYVIKHLNLPPLSELTNRKFVPAQEHFVKMGYKTKIKINKNKQASFIAENNGRTIEYPANQNIRMVNGQKETLPGIVIYNGKDFWIPLL
ncbi:alkaline phosphatase [Siminovitchia terrae]|uniref:Alkaline phosphatase n=1 Tax=Siminovitchia terrae TaxID=1914933 RepID=A0A429XC69_SIMTE|nr:alkaline phosphatase [Siminovitchia terrae]RST61010.1 alkaline phosphatase [Siminovitchia terrae]